MRATGAQTEGDLARGRAPPPARPRTSAAAETPADTTSSGVGLESDAATSAASRAASDNESRWSATSSWSVRGTRSGSSAAESAMARASSSAKYGLPPDAVAMRASTGLGGDDVESLAHEVVQGSHRERADDQQREPLLRQRAPQPERSLVCLVGSDRREHSRRPLEPTCCELEDAARRTVEPLRVVDRDDERPVSREPCEHAGERRCDESRVGRLVGRLAQQRCGESALLHGRQGGARLVEAHADEVRERGVRKPRLRLRRSCSAARGSRAAPRPRRRPPTGSSCRSPPGPRARARSAPRGSRRGTERSRPARVSVTGSSPTSGWAVLGSNQRPWD